MTVMEGSRQASMARKKKIAILYNEPVVGTEAGKRYIAENERRKDISATGKKVKSRKGKLLATQALVDLSEIGVVEEMEDIEGKEGE